MRPLALFVLALVFLDELLCMAAYAVVGWHSPARWLLVWLLPAAAMTVWFFFCSPKARWGGGGVRPVVKVLVFSLAGAGLVGTGHPVLAVALIVFSAVVNGVAQARFVRDTQSAML